MTSVSDSTQSRTLEFEVSLPSADPVQALEVGVQADALGFDAVSLPDHIFQPRRFEESLEGRADLFTTLGALAQATSRVKLGQAMVCAPFRHPVQLARAITSLDRLSGGRARLGIGAGWYQAEFEAMGIPFPKPPERRALLVETLEILQAYWTQERVNYKGKFFQVHDCLAEPRLLQTSPPDITVGGSAPALLEIAGRYADAVNVLPPWLTPKRIDLVRGLSTTAQDLRSKVQTVREAAQKAGRDPESVGIAVNLQVLVDRDQKNLDAALGAVAKSLGVEASLVCNSPMTLVGTPAACVEKLSRLQEEIGFQRVVCSFFVPQQMGLFAEEVLSGF
ncbi:MAG: LLM class flavin-dependent oxidoreductase [Deltaproteobacteria bacterium]|nr:LLM class flavin-dependent oxidoreductase [Deltaproteobacteria bacterium]